MTRARSITLKTSGTVSVFFCFNTPFPLWLDCILQKIPGLGAALPWGQVWHWWSCWCWWAPAWLPSHAFTLLWTPGWRLKAYATSFCSKYSKCLCTHTNPACLCGSHAVLVMAVGCSSFPWLLSMEDVDATAQQLRNCAKVKGFVMSGFLQHFSGGGLGHVKFILVSVL